MGSLLIGDVAKRTGITPATIRYYESIGLVSPPPRSGAGYRRYGETTLEELNFIKKAQGLGFSLEEMQEILRFSRRGEAPCSHVLELSKRHLAAVEERITRSSLVFAKSWPETSPTGKSRISRRAMESAR